MLVASQAMGDETIEELALGDYLKILQRRWLWVALPLLVLPALAYYLAVSEADRFDASAQVLLNDSAAQDAIGGGSQSTSFRDRILVNEIRLALSDEAMVEIGNRLGLNADDVPDFNVTADASSDVLVFSTTQSTPDGASTLSNVAAETYVSLKQDQASASITEAVDRLEATLTDLQEERDDLRSELVRLEALLADASDETRPAAQARVDQEASRVSGPVGLIEARIDATADSVTQLELTQELALGGTARIVSVANPPLTSSNTPPSRNIVLGLVVGAILGAALALLRENLDNKIRTVDDLERMGIMPIGSIPKASNRSNKSSNLARVAETAPESPQAQAHQKTQATLRFLTMQHGISNVLITSPSQSEGKTTLASNLAIAMARNNIRTVLVDLDLRRPRIHKAYGVKQSPGISSVVMDGIDVVDSAFLIDGLDDHLAVVPAGKLPPHPASFISSIGFTETVKELSKLSDFTVFDAPPVLPVADTLTLSQLVGGVIVVAYANKTTRNEMEDAVDSLRASGAVVLGAVLLGASVDTNSYAYYDADDELERV